MSDSTTGDSVKDPAMTDLTASDTTASAPTMSDPIVAAPTASDRTAGPLTVSVRKGIEHAGPWAPSGVVGFLPSTRQASADTGGQDGVRAIRRRNAHRLRW
jgi:hypothetical protein